MKHLLAVLVVALGVAAFVHGARDDSPGLQLIGLVLAVGAVVLTVRSTARGRRAG